MSKEKIKTEETPTKKTTAVKTSQEGKVGTMLHDVRTKNKLTIEQVSADLRIKSTYITAIENSDYANIPEHPYGLGFVRSYAEYLGLNSARITQIFKEEIESLSIANYKYKAFAVDEQNETNNQNRKYLLVSLIMVLLGYSLWNLLGDTYEDEQPVNNNQEVIVVENKKQTLSLPEEDIQTISEETTPDGQTKTPTEQINVTEEKIIDDIQAPETTNKEDTPQAFTETTSVTPQEKQDSEISKKEEVKKTSRVVLKIKKETWIEVKDSDKDKLWISKVLNAGDEYIVPENGERKIVSFGNTDGVDVVIDGKIVTVVSKNKKTNIKLDAFLSNH